MSEIVAVAGNAVKLFTGHYIRSLKAYSGDLLDRLQRFTEVPAPEGHVSIRRPVVGVVAEAARQGSLVITGDPGAGKSAVIHQVAEALTRDAPVVAFRRSR